MGDDHKRAGGDAKGKSDKHSGDRHPGEVIRKDTDVKSGHASRREKDVVTEGSEDSFPASDPPSYMGGSAVSGSPPSRKSDEPDQDDVPQKDAPPKDAPHRK